MEQIISGVENWFEGAFPQLTGAPYSTLLFMITTIVIGVVNCFLGYRLFPFLIDAAAFLLGALLGYWLAGFFTPLWWICLLCALLAGTLLALLAVKLYYAACFLAVGIPAAILACGLLTVYLPDLQSVVCCLLGLLAGILAGILTVRLQRPMIIISSAFYGAYSAISGIFETARIYNVSLMLLITAVLALAGMIFQFGSAGKQRR